MGWRRRGRARAEEEERTAPWRQPPRSLPGSLPKRKEALLLPRLDWGWRRAHRRRIKAEAPSIRERVWEGEEWGENWQRRGCRIGYWWRVRGAWVCSRGRHNSRALARLRLLVVREERGPYFGEARAAWTVSSLFSGNLTEIDSRRAWLVR